MEIINLKISEIKKYKTNAKLHTPEQIQHIKASIEKFGFNDPIGIWGNENEIVEGHGRLEALKQLGCTEVECIRLDHLSDEERRAYMLAHNQTNIETGFDFDLLKIELDGIFDIDMSTFGFIDESDNTEPHEDEFDVEANITDEPVAKLGNIWQLGRHRLMCGDSTDAGMVALLMDGVKADMVFTDPPYGVNYQSNMRTKTQKFDIIENDDKLLDFVPLCLEFSKGFIFICASWKVLKNWLNKIDGIIELSNMIIWDKGGGGIGDLKKTFSTDYEVIMCANRGNEITGKRLGSVWNIGKDSANKYNHPTQKPIKLSATAIENTTKLQNVVLDLFGGSGSTLIACEQLNRTCYMMELDPKYVDVIIKRYEQFTGNKAELISDK